MPEPELSNLLQKRHKNDRRILREQLQQGPMRHQSKDCREKWLMLRDMQLQGPMRLQSNTSRETKPMHSRQQLREPMRHQLSTHLQRIMADAERHYFNKSQ